VPIDPAAIGAAGIRKQNGSVVVLELGMHAADALVVELQMVYAVALTADTDRSLQAKRLPPQTHGPFENS
jgi:hypothetical protein